MHQYLPTNRSRLHKPPTQQQIFRNQALTYAILKRNSQTKIRDEFSMFAFSNVRKNSLYDKNGKSTRHSFQQFNRSRSKSSQKRIDINTTKNNNQILRKRPVTAWSDSFKERKTKELLMQSCNEPDIDSTPLLSERESEPSIFYSQTQNTNNNNLESTKSYQYYVAKERKKIHAQQKQSFDYLMEPCKIKKIHIHNRPGSSNSQYSYFNIGSEKAIIVRTTPRKYHAKSYYESSQNKNVICPWDNDQNQNIQVFDDKILE